MAGEEVSIWKTLTALLLLFVVTSTNGLVYGNEVAPPNTDGPHSVGVTVDPPIYPLNPYEWEELARYIYRYKTKRDGGIWNICGHSLSKEEMKEAALQYSKELLIAHHTTTYPIRRGGVRYEVKVPLKGVLGTMMSESRLDYCALGPNPRKWAYKHGLLEKNPEGQRGTPSYSKENILAVLNHPKWRKRLADLGLGQMVWGEEESCFCVSVFTLRERRILG